MKRYIVYLFQMEEKYDIGVPAMPNLKWSDLPSRVQVGRLGEYYAMIECTSYGFEVYSSEVDDHGVDFVAKGPNGVFYEVQVKSLRANTSSYTFVQKNKNKLDANHLICFVYFVDDKHPDCYVIPSTVFIEAEGEPKGSTPFVSRNYTDLKSPPEYGINVSEKNLVKLQEYRAEKILPGMRGDSQNRGNTGVYKHAYQ